MTTPRASSWTKPAVRVAAAGLGAAVAGPLGGAIGGWIGGAIGGSLADLVAKYAEKFGDKAAEKILETAADSLTEKLQQSSPRLEDVYRQALRLSLADLHAQIRWDNFEDWFANWEGCLAVAIPLNLFPITPDQLEPERLDDLFRLTMQRLDAQGAAIRQQSVSLTLQIRAIPDALLSVLIDRLPEPLQENFRTLVVKPENDQAWKQAQLIFQDFASATLTRIPQIADDTAVIRRIIEGELDRASKEGSLAREQYQAARAQIEALTAELQKLKQQVTERKSEPGEAALSNLLDAGDLDGALRVKTEQVEARRGELGKLARDLFELGTIHELRFSWPDALQAYRDAWRLEPDPEYGFKYAYFAQRQNQFQEAVGAYGTVLTRYRELAEANPEAY